MRYNKDTCTVEMSVRSLCALALKTGDIDARRRTSVSVLVDAGVSGVGGGVYRERYANQ